MNIPWVDGLDDSGRERSVADFGFFRIVVAYKPSYGLTFYFVNRHGMEFESSGTVYGSVGRAKVCARRYLERHVREGEA